MSTVKTKEFSHHDDAAHPWLLWLWLFQTRLMTVYDHVTSAMQRVTGTNWWQVTCETDSRRPRHPPSPRQRRTLRHRNIVQVSRKKCSAKHQLCTLLHAARRRNTARGASTPAKPGENMPLPWSTTCVATKRETSTICSRILGTATSTKQDENRPQEPSLPRHVET